MIEAVIIDDCIGYAKNPIERPYAQKPHLVHLIWCMDQTGSYSLWVLLTVGKTRSDDSVSFFIYDQACRKFGNFG
jgi:hypothetical protein